MKNQRLRLSILDQSPVQDGYAGPEALQRTIELAQAAERWGYHRFWVAEHHNSDSYMGSSPEVLISHLLAKTSRIRLGSGGVMLQHYSPYKVAENFNVLASLGPGRVDLGIGRGPGGLPRSTRALQEELAAEKKPFRNKLVELEHWLGRSKELDDTPPGVSAKPLPPEAADVFLLGTTTASAEMAAELGMPYVYALFLNNDAKAMGEAVQVYRDNCGASRSRPDQVMLALPVIVADTDGEARELAADVKMVRITLESGRTFTVGSVESAYEFGRQVGEEVTIEESQGDVIHGSLSTVASRLACLQERHRVDEFIVVTALKRFDQRLRSYELLSRLISG